MSPRTPHLLACLFAQLRAAFSRPVSRRLGLALLACGLITGCLSAPTLPLPPPSPVDATPPENGETRLTGAVAANGVGVRVFALNLRTDLIDGQDTPEGTFDFRAPAESGDVFVVWYRAGGLDSESVLVEVPALEALAPEAQVDAGAEPDAGSE